MSSKTKMCFIQEKKGKNKITPRGTYVYALCRLIEKQILTHNFREKIEYYARSRSDWYICINVVFNVTIFHDHDKYILIIIFDVWMNNNLFSLEFHLLWIWMKKNSFNWKSIRFSLLFLTIKTAEQSIDLCHLPVHGNF